MKPRIFIGSSKEGKSVAEAIHSELQHPAECTVWTQGIFGLSATNIENLMRQVDTSEFEIFVFSADDAVTMRGKLFSAPRDNVVYELGLFSGALGRERCFFVTPEGTDIHLPTDLLGMTAGWYETGRRDQNFRAAVGPFCSMVRQRIEELTLGLSFLRPEPNALLCTGWQTFTCQCTARPGPDVFLVTQKGDRWLPRQEKLELITDNKYEVKTYFSENDPGSITVHIMKATRNLPILWVESYRNIVDQAKRYPPMFRGDLPPGFFSLASIPVEVVGERVIYDGRQSISPEDLSGRGNVRFNAQRQRYGDPGEGHYIVTDRTINITRTNTAGRWEIQLERLTTGGDVVQTLEPAPHLNKRTLTFSFEAKIQGGRHSLITVVRNAQTSAWLGSETRSITSTDWCPFSFSIAFDPTSPARIRFDDHNESAPSGLHIRRLVITEPPD
jgi:hypothetical protein